MSSFFDMFLVPFYTDAKCTTLNRIANNLNLLDKKNSGKVDISLTESKKKILFTKHKGEWLAKSDEGKWISLTDVELRGLTELENIIDALIEKEKLVS